MCGIIAFAGRRPAAAPLLAGLSFLQHRGQDACGVATIADGRILRRRGSGLLREVFSQADATDLRGEMGIGHVRYPTAGGAFVESEAQPLYVNQPFGMVLAHNGNIVNAAQLRRALGSRGAPPHQQRFGFRGLAESARQFNRRQNPFRPPRNRARHFF